MGTIVKFKIQTTDSQPIAVDFGDNTAILAEHDTFIEHEYTVTGTYDIKVTHPNRVLAIIDDESVAERKGTVSVSNFTNMTTLALRNSAITEVDVEGVPLASVDVSGNDLTAASIDDLITDIEGLSTSSGTLNYDNQDDGTEAWASRSAGAQAAQEALETRTWAVTPAVPIIPRWYVPFNADNYDYEVMSSKAATSKYADIVFEATGGKFNGYAKLITPSAGTAAPLLWTGATDAANFQVNFKNNWTIEFFFKVKSTSDGNVLFNFSDSGYRFGNNYIWFTIQKGVSWNIAVRTVVGGVTKINDVYNNVSETPSTSVWKFYRLSFNAAAGKLRLANETSVFATINCAAADMPDLSATGANMYAYIAGVTAYNPAASYTPYLDNVACILKDMINHDTDNVVPTAEYSY